MKIKPEFYIKVRPGFYWVFGSKEEMDAAIAVRARCLARAAKLAAKAAAAGGAMLLIYGAGVMALHDLNWFITTGVLP